MDLCDLRDSRARLASELASVTFDCSLHTFVSRDRNYFRVTCDLAAPIERICELAHAHANTCWVPTCNIPPSSEETNESKIPGIIAAHDTVLFMQGTPEEPFCGESRRMSRILEETNTDFYPVNILSDSLSDMVASFSVINPPVIYYKRVLLHPQHYQQAGLESFLKKCESLF